MKIEHSQEIPHDYVSSVTAFFRDNPPPGSAIKLVWDLVPEPEAASIGKSERFLDICA